MDQRLAVGLGAAAVFGIGLGAAAAVGNWFGSDAGAVSVAAPSSSGVTPSGSSQAVVTDGAPSGVTLSATAGGSGFAGVASVSSSPARSPVPPSRTTSAAARSTPSPTGAPSPSASFTGPLPLMSTTTYAVLSPFSPSTGYTAGPTTRAGTPTPSMALVVYRTSADGTATVVLGARVSAFLPVMDGGDSLVSRTLSFGDGTTSRVTSAQRCVAGAAARSVEGSWAYEHTYTRPGTYTVTFEAVACPPVGTRTQTLQVTVV